MCFMSCLQLFMYLLKKDFDKTKYLICKFSSHVLGDELLGLAYHPRHAPVLLLNLG